MYRIESGLHQRHRRALHVLTLLISLYCSPILHSRKQETIVTYKSVVIYKFIVTYKSHVLFCFFKLGHAAWLAGS